MPNRSQRGARSPGPAVSGERLDRFLFEVDHLLAGAELRRDRPSIPRPARRRLPLFPKGVFGPRSGLRAA